MKISDEYVFKKKKEALVDRVIAKLVQFSVHSKKTIGIFTIYLQLLCETSHAYKDKW